MGAWGIGNFENDNASDWVYSLEVSEGTALLEKTLNSVLAEEYPEAPECSEALAAAEVVAALYGIRRELPDIVSGWVEQQNRPMDQDLMNLAVQAVEHIEKSSELKDLWVESEDAGSWSELIDGLLRQLQSK